MNETHYSMVIQWDERDHIYVVRVPELPGCSTHGGTIAEAVENARDAIDAWIDAAITTGEPVPTPRVLGAV